MRLTELNPRWGVGCQWKDASNTGTMIYNQDNYWKRHGMALIFDCPVHRFHRLAVFFKNPIDGQPHEDKEDKYLWERTGDTFETLTLNPSINASDTKYAISYNPVVATPCWHGFIKNGEIC